MLLGPKGVEIEATMAAEGATGREGREGTEIEVTMAAEAGGVGAGERIGATVGEGDRDGDRDGEAVRRSLVDGRPRVEDLSRLLLRLLWQALQHALPPSNRLDLTLKFLDWTVAAPR